MVTNGGVGFGKMLMRIIFNITSNRGGQTIKELFPKGFPNAILNSDRWKPHLSTNTKGHQLCISHLLRDLNYLIELEKTGWAKEMKTLFQKTLALKRAKSKYKKNNLLVVEIESKTDKLLTQLDQQKNYVKKIHIDYQQVINLLKNIHFVNISISAY